ncbi:MAG: UDP-2,3-diacylglucosamine diphosphatase [Elusimicrobiota bacterium]
MEKLNTIIISDVHLGSPNSRAFDLTATLKSMRFKRIVINGDMFEDLNFEKLTSTHWELLEHIGKLSRRDVEVVWIKGNHDGKFQRLMSYMIGIPVREEFIWEAGGRRFIALHGHQFDSFISNNKILGRLLASMYTSFQRVVSSQLFDWIMLKLADRWLRATEQIAGLALEYAVKKKCDVVVCGHTHFMYNITKDSTEYYNTGCWNNKPSYLLAVEDDGSVNLKAVA